MYDGSSKAFLYLSRMLLIHINLEISPSPPTLSYQT